MNETRIESIIRKCREERRPPTFDEARELAVHYSSQGCFADGNGPIKVNIRKLEKQIREGEKNE